MKHRGFLMIMLMMGLVVGVQAQTPLPPTPTPPGPLVLTVWMPDVLASADQPLARAEISRQIQAFNASQSAIEVEIRLKMVDNIGGIMSTLRAASSVAPGALPDLTLVQRKDLVPAQRDGLLQSFEGKLPPAQVTSLDTSIKLGQVNNQWVGLPYLMELEHLVVRPPTSTTTETALQGWAYADVLKRDEPIVFPVGHSNGISDAVYLQYMAAGGSLNGENMLIYNADALNATLTFYAQARDQGVLDNRLVNYLSPTDYLSDFESRKISTALFHSANYFQFLQTDATLTAAPIPTMTGQNIAMLDGWMWVLVSASTDRQNAAIQFLNFLMQPDNQSAYARTLNLLPSQRSVLIDTLPRTVDQDVYLSLLDNAILPLAESEGGPLASDLQEAVESVLKGDKTVTQALVDLEQQHQKP